jgi:ADP-ribose pyrophosphatase YjhB (NUDIX family)
VTDSPWIDDATWEAVQGTVPITCVDLLPFRRGGTEVALVLRATPFGAAPRWCHMGGRVRHGETVRAALLRHLHETVSGADVVLAADPQPDYVMQWFPDAVDPARDGVAYGWDPRQHAVALCFAVELTGAPEPVPGGEALRFGWFPTDGLTEPLWPGTAAVVAALAGRLSSGTRPVS